MDCSEFDMYTDFINVLRVFVIFYWLCILSLQDFMLNCSEVQVTNSGVVLGQITGSRPPRIVRYERDT
jgi:hypothetical protein